MISYNLNLITSCTADIICNNEFKVIYSLWKVKSCYCNKLICNLSVNFNIIQLNCDSCFCTVCCICRCGKFNFLCKNRNFYSIWNCILFKFRIKFIIFIIRIIVSYLKVCQECCILLNYLKYICCLFRFIKWWVNCYEEYIFIWRCTQIIIIRNIINIFCWYTVMCYDNRICRFSWNCKNIYAFLTCLNDCRILEYFWIERINYCWRCIVVVQVSVAIVKNKIVKTNLTLCSFTSSYYHSVISNIVCLWADNSKVDICSSIIIFHKRYRKNKFLSYICEHFNLIFCSQLCKNSIVFIFFLYNKWNAVICIINYCLIQSDKFVIILIKFIFTVIRFILFYNCQICKICVTLIIRSSYNF